MIKRCPLIITLLLIFLPVSCTVVAETISNVHVQQEGNRYILHIEAEIDADPQTVIKIITDYENLTSINPYLKESKIISGTDSDTSTRVWMLTEACFFIICYELRHVQTFNILSPGVIYGKIIADESDFKSGWTRWTINNADKKTDEHKTHFLLDAEVTPDFFILPIIGPYQLKKKILTIALQTIHNLENKAQENY